MRSPIKTVNNKNWITGFTGKKAGKSSRREQYIELASKITSKKRKMNKLRNEVFSPKVFGKNRERPITRSIKRASSNTNWLTGLIVREAKNWKGSNMLRPP